MAKEKTSDHFDGKHFFNLDGVDSRKSLFSLLKWKFSGGAAKWPEHVENLATPQLPAPGSVANGEAYVTFVNHATELVQMHELNVLTDPVFSERVSPVGWAGPKRVRTPGLKVPDLPKIDVVVISHNHYDHLDLNSLKGLYQRNHPLFIVPLGNKALLESVGIERGVIELDWWQRHSLGEGKSVTLVPAQHWSARGLFDRNEALWGGYVIEAGGVRVFFAGDTGYGAHFKEIAKRAGPIDLALLPIGAYEPRWFMKDQHMNPDDAVQAHVDLQSLLSLGMHFGCFQLTDESLEDPAKALSASLRERKIPDAAFKAPQTGETTVFRRAP